MSDNTKLAYLANSYRPVSGSLTESYRPHGSSDAPQAVPHLVSGVGPAVPLAPAPTSAPSTSQTQNNGRE